MSSEAQKRDYSPQNGFLEAAAAGFLLREGRQIGAFCLRVDSPPRLLSGQRGTWWPAPVSQLRQEPAV